LRIAFLSPYPALPVVYGAVRRIWSLAAHLAKMGNDVFIISKSNNEGYMIKDRVKIFFCPSLIPQSLCKLGNAKMVKELIGLHRQLDIVQCEFPYMFPPSYLAKLFGKPLVLDEHGVEAIHFREVSYNIAPSKTKAELIYLIEKIALKYSTMIFACSKVDAEKICQLFKIPPPKVAVIPNGVESSFFEKIQPFEYSQPTVLFLGGVGHPPNRYAIEKLLQEIIPFVLTQMKRVQFSFVGRNDGYPLISSENVGVHGQVNDVRPYIYGSDICVAPIYHGTGTRLKILEYMACGKPVVATNKAVEGLEGVSDGENIIIRDDAKDFSQAIVDLLSDESERKKIGRAARELVKERYNWENIAKKAMKCYKRIS
jgi:glycosyltransferase involved in cell wall biosynthesis